MTAEGSEEGAVRRGLSQAEADRLLLSVGRNEPVSTERPSIVWQVLRHFQSPLVFILLVSSAASAVLRDFMNAGIVVLIVGMSVLVELVQTRRSERAAEGLKAQVAQTASVLRDGILRELPRALVVPGDLVRLAAGDMVPADGRLLEAKDLHLNEAALTGESLPSEKRPEDSVLMGTSVVSGTGLAEITLTGKRTTFGAIAASLSERAPQSEFERGIARFGAFILKTVLLLILFAFLATALVHRDPLESLMFAVALAVGLTPEFLPMITTVTLTRGAVRMAREKVIVKNLAAIQNFGSIDVLCSDKTGTLTTGEMKLERHVDPSGGPSERPLLFGYVNSYFESGVDNPEDEAVLHRERRNPLDSAMLRHEHPDIHGYVKVDEIPFDFERRCVSVVAARGDETLLVTKGAPERVLAVSSFLDEQGQVRALSADDRARCERTVEALSAEGYRVLGVGYSRVVKGTEFSKEDERDLTIAGYLAFADPLREGVRAVLSELAREGVVVKVLTGDSDLAARHVCSRVGISTDRIVLGSDIDAMSDPALLFEAERTQIFARVSPAQKNRIIHALKARGHVVGFLGDGINDAPSLHAADVGISVSSAVDVAKDAANVILLEPGLAVLLRGILEGRRAFGNVMKYLLMETSSNFGNMFSMAGATLLLPFLPMLPTQILLNNFLYDLAQITIPSDHVDAEFMRKPKRWDIGLIRRFMLFIGPISSLYDFLTFYVLLRVFHAPEQLFHTGWFVESLSTQSLVIFVVRTFGSPFRSRPSLPLVLSTLATVALGITLPFTPLAPYLGFSPLPGRYFAFLGAATGTYLVIVEVVKRTVLRRVLR